MVLLFTNMWKSMLKFLGKLFGWLVRYTLKIVKDLLALYELERFHTWLTWYTILLGTRISGPIKQVNTNIEVTLITKCTANDSSTSVALIRELFTLLWTFETGINLPYFNLKKIVSADNVINKLGFQSISATYSASLAFLLLDEPKVAYGFCKYIESQFEPPSMTVACYILLQNGSKKMVRNWDIKVLAAMKSINSLLINEHVGREIKIDDMSKIRNIGERTTLDAELFENFAKACNAIEGKFSSILPSLRLEFYKHICKVCRHLSTSQINEYKSIIVSRYYGHTDCKKDLISLTALTLILKLISDGMLCSREDLIEFANINFFPVSTNLQLMLKYKDIQAQNAGEDVSHPASNISPHFNLLGGTRVRCGECLIINQTFQHDPKRYRSGTTMDEAQLIKTWEKLGCRNRIVVKRDLARNEIIEELKNFRDKLKATIPDFVVIVILTHGSLNKRKHTDFLLDAERKKMSMAKIKNMFVDGKQCPTMIGKPKLFFVQACRGTKSLNMIDTDLSETDEENDNDIIEQNGINHVNKSWFFVFQSTIKGFASMRHPERGTIFIQTLCQELMKNGTRLNLATIASCVNQKIMRKYNIQAPIYENQLGDFVYFDPCE